MDMIKAFEDTIELAKARGYDRPRPVSVRPDATFGHLVSMLDLAKAGVADGTFSEGKLGRWLGYAQGVLVADGIVILDEMKAINQRHADPKPEPAPEPAGHLVPPPIGSIWRHRRNGGQYLVIDVANMAGDRDYFGEFPPMVVYRNVENYLVWARPLNRWAGSFYPMPTYAAMRPRMPAAPEDHYTVAALGVAMFAEVAHAESKARGWYQDPATGEPVERNLGEMIALIHSELSEALEAIRKSANDDKLPDRPGVIVEMADALIRIGDFVAYLATRPDMRVLWTPDQLDIGAALVAKMQYNAKRHDHSLEARRAAGGKAF